MKVLFICFVFGAVHLNKSLTAGRIFRNFNSVSVTEDAETTDTYKSNCIDSETAEGNIAHEKVNKTERKTKASWHDDEDGFPESKMDDSKKKKKKRKPSLLKAVLECSHPDTYGRLKSSLERDSNSGEPFDVAEEFVLGLYECIKILTFQYIDRILNRNQIPLGDNLFFVKDKSNDEIDLAEKYPRGLTSTGGEGWRMEEEEYDDDDASEKEYVRSILSGDLISLIFDRLENFWKTHSLKYQMNKALQVDGRGRRRDHKVLALMVMGFMIMASILIPTGFQFLTVLGGKSLLMAKMALIMSAISGLKKIATSNVGYGFYQTGNEGHLHEHLHPGFHEKVYQGNPQQGGHYPVLNL